MKYPIIMVGLFAILAAVFFALNTYIYNEKQGGALDPKSATYTIDNRPVTLIHGERVENMGSDARQILLRKQVTKYFGNDAKGDLNGDGIPDIAFILTQTTGGTGTFFYVVVALQNSSGRFNGLNGILLGDRVAPQTTEIRDGILTVNYADRLPHEPFSAQPTQGVSLRLRAEGSTLVAAD